MVIPMRVNSHISKVGVNSFFYHKRFMQLPLHFDFQSKHHYLEKYPIATMLRKVAMKQMENLLGPVVNAAMQLMNLGSLREPEQPTATISWTN